MKQVVVLSGKGGTGKTTLSSGFAALADRVVAVDADVDASNMHILLGASDIQEFEFTGKTVADIDLDQCTECGLCLDVCRFNAISADFVVDPVDCEGCDACRLICPVDAVEMVERVSGTWRKARLKNGWLVDASLLPGGENTGKLVDKVRHEGTEIAQGNGVDLVVIDGPPGIGCPVISSITGTDLVVAVVEPTVSAVHDLKRLLELAGHFRVPVAAVINRFDIAPQASAELEKYLGKQGVTVVGHIPFDENIYKALERAMPAVELAGPGAEAIVNAWEKVKALL